MASASLLPADNGGETQWRDLLQPNGAYQSHTVAGGRAGPAQAAVAAGPTRKLALTGHILPTAAWTPEYTGSSTEEGEEKTSETEMTKHRS